MSGLSNTSNTISIVCFASITVYFLLYSMYPLNSSPSHKPIRFAILYSKASKACEKFASIFVNS